MKKHPEEIIHIYMQDGRRLAIVELPRGAAKVVCDHPGGAQTSQRFADAGAAALFMLLAKTTDEAAEREGRDDALTCEILNEIYEERKRQHKKWGRQVLPSFPSAETMNGQMAPQWFQIPSADRARSNCKRAAKEGRCTFGHIMAEEIAEVYEEADPKKLQAELIQVAAVALQWCEEIDRQGRGE